MDDYNVSSIKRPVRLSENTRKFADESMHGRYGDETMKTPFVSMDDMVGFSEMTSQQKYNAMIMKIAQEAPLRICKNESVSGAATLGEGIKHRVPAYFNGQSVFSSISHLTVDFSTVLLYGVDYLDKKIRNKLLENISAKQKTELEGFQNVIRALHIYHERYLSALKDEMPDNYVNLKNVPFCPPTNFREAVQSLWFTFSFIRLCGNWPGIGRMDEMLGGYLKHDLNTGIITLDEAREFLAGMFIKGCEWIQSNTPCGSGDAQHYQNIVLGGVDAEGNEITNEVTYLVLDIVEELGISDYPITVRVNNQSPDRLLVRVAEVIRHGGGIIAVYNEPLILQSLTKFGYSEREARRFANDGCWEVQIPGKTNFSYIPFDSLQILLNETLNLNSETPTCFESFDELYSAFAYNLNNKIESIYQKTVEKYLHKGDKNEWCWNPSMPSSVVSLLEDGCIESGRSYYSGGPKYTVVSPHIGGAPDVGNSLYAIDKLVYQEKKVTFSSMMSILKNDWEGEELLRQYVTNKFTYYGNDCDECDSYTVAVLNDFADMTNRLNGRCPIMFPAGISTFGRQIEWRCARCAVPFGRKKNEILSGNASPTPDTDFEGATAEIRSYCKINHLKQTCGAALDVKLFPSSVSGKNGVESLKALIRGFVNLGGFFMQIDVVDSEVLRDAQLHPEKYKTLSVRVSGWNARFVTLNSEWQKMIIERTTQNID